LSKRRIGSADSARGAAEELYDDAGQRGLHPVAMLDEQINDLIGFRKINRLPGRSAPGPHADSHRDRYVGPASRRRVSRHSP
jgi:hypothetical protein